MTRTKDAPGLQVYYEAQKNIFKLQSEIMTGVLTHSGERGRNDEEHLRNFLNKVLPRRFSIGTGFIVSSDLAEKPSGQNDIIISDQFWNSPLYREFVAEVYPIETVYGTIEVKGVIQKHKKGRNKTTDIDDALSNIAKIRSLAKEKKYVRYTGKAKDENEPDKLVVYPEKSTISIPPRAYIFAYAKKGWRNLDAFRKDIEEHLRRHTGAHLHGIVVLEKDWFAFQETYDPNVTVHAFNNNALIRFTNTMLRGIQSFPMHIASIDDYHRMGLYESVEAGDPQCSAFNGDPEPSEEV